MSATLLDHLPIWEVASDHIVSKMGDSTFAYRITKPAIFTLSGPELRTYYQTWEKAISTLPPNTIIHMMDWYIRSSWQGQPDRPDASYLTRASEQYHQGRPCLNHHCWLLITRRPARRASANAANNALLRRSLIPEDTLSPEADASFTAEVSQFIHILTDSGLIRAEQIPTDQLASQGDQVGIIEQYCMLLAPDHPPLLQDISFDKGIRIGDQHCLLHTLADLTHMPDHCSPFVDHTPYSTDRTHFPIGFASPLGLLLNHNHIYSQYIIIEDEPITRRQLELKRRRLQSLSAHSRENALSKTALDEFLETTITSNQKIVKAHFNILSWTDDPAKKTAMGNQVAAAITKLGATPHLETVMAPQIWCAGIPGNAADLPLFETITLPLQQAVCFLMPDSNEHSNATAGLRLGDRLQGRPLLVDLTTGPLQQGLIKNFNKLVLGGSGSGKSYFINHLLNSYYEQGFHILIADIGNSYKRLCEHCGGYYFTYTEQAPLSFNPFWLAQGEYLDLEKKESIKNLLLAVWKKEDQGYLQSEYVALSNAIQQYYAYLDTHSEIFACFDSFYEFLQEEFAHTLVNDRVKEKDFDIGNFLYVLRPFYKKGEYDFLLNARENIDLLNQRFIVFELDAVKDHFLFPVVTIVIMEAFINKMRKLPGLRKVIMIDEAWKAMTRPGTSEFIQFLYKTIRKFNGEPIVAAQEIEDIISSPVVKQAIINNSDCKIILDQSKYEQKFDFIQETLGLTDKDKTLILSLNKNNDPHRKYKEVFIGLGTQSKIYRVELSLEEYLTYTTQETERLKVEEYARQQGSLQKGIMVLAAAIRNGSVKWIVTGLLVLAGVLMPGGQTRAQFPIAEIISAAIKKVIVATDLAIQRLQNQTIHLQNAQKEVENAMQQFRLDEITDWVQQQKDLYAGYYQELWQVKNALTLYQEIVTITDRQRQILTGYKRALATLRQDPHFNAAELEDMALVYGGILDESLRTASQLMTIITGFTTQMQDGDRLHLIDQLADDVDKTYRNLQTFTQENILLSLQRSKDQQDLKFIRSMYGIQ